MQVHIVPDAAAGGALVADLFEEVIREAGEAGAVLGLATGSSPLTAYAELIRRHRERGLSFAHSRAFTLDEYVGLSGDHPQSYRRFIHEHLVDQVDLPASAVDTPDGAAADPDLEAIAYERRLQDAGGVDLQILGIGSNGHIAFNEPGSDRASRTRVVDLAPSTIADNARFFGDPSQVPVRAISQGLGTLAEARRIVLTASGAGKAEAIAHLLEGEMTDQWPATALQQHPQVTVVVDEAAASRLTRSDARHS